MKSMMLAVSLTSRILYCCLTLNHPPKRWVVTRIPNSAGKEFFAIRSMHDCFRLPNSHIIELYEKIEDRRNPHIAPEILHDSVFGPRVRSTQANRPRRWLFEIIFSVARLCDLPTTTLLFCVYCQRFSRLEQELSTSMSCASAFGSLMQ
jgi:hypothetical protein